VNVSYPNRLKTEHVIQSTTLLPPASAIFSRPTPSGSYLPKKWAYALSSNGIYSLTESLLSRKTAPRWTPIRSAPTKMRPGDSMLDAEMHWYGQNRRHRRFLSSGTFARRTSARGKAASGAMQVDARHAVAWPRHVRGLRRRSSDRFPISNGKAQFE
jgi:hypothetical protein